MDGGTLAPWANVKFGNNDIFKGIYESLCVMNSDGSVSNDLMQSVTKVDDLHYNITIYDNIYDTAGNHITASDVVFSINDGYVGIGKNQGGVSDLDHVEKVDDYTIQWINKTPFGNGMEYKEFANPRIVSQAAYEASSDGMATDPVGSAAYVVTSYVPGSSIVLEKNTKYWQTDPTKLSPCGIANVDKITYNIILDSSQMAMALQAGNIDFAGALNSTDLEDFTGNPNFNIVEKPSVLPFLLLFNPTDQSPCSDINLRKAILEGVDNNAIVAALTEESVPLTSISNPHGVDYQPEWANRTQWSYDADAAKAALAQSGYKSGTELKLLVNNGSSVGEGCAMVIQSELQEIGITVTIDTVDSATYRTQSTDASAYDLLLMENGGGPYSTQCWNNAFSYTSGKTPINDSTLQQKLDSAIATGAPTDLNAFQDYVDQMAYGKGLVQPIFRTASSTKIAQVFLGQDNNYLIGCSIFN